MEARESNCSTLKEPEIPPLRKRAMAMKASEIRRQKALDSGLPRESCSDKSDSYEGELF